MDEELKSLPPCLHIISFQPSPPLSDQNNTYKQKKQKYNQKKTEE